MYIFIKILNTSLYIFSKVYVTWRNELFACRDIQEEHEFPDNLISIQAAREAEKRI